MDLAQAHLRDTSAQRLRGCENAHPRPRVASRTCPTRPGIRTRGAVAQAGFTLIELLVVMIIIGIVMGVAVDTMLSLRRAGSDSQYVAGAGQVWHAVMAYRMDDQGRLPNTAMLAGGGATLRNPANVAYIRQWPDDPRLSTPLVVQPRSGAAPPTTSTPSTVSYASAGTTGWLAAYGSDGSLIFSRVISPGPSPKAPVG